MSESPAYVPPFVRVTGDSGLPLNAGEAGGDSTDGEFDDDDGDVDADAVQPLRQHGAARGMGRVGHRTTIAMRHLPAPQAMPQLRKLLAECPYRGRLRFTDRSLPGCR